MSVNKLIVGLTGGIATGKSFAAEMFRELGADIISADEVAREVVLPGTQGRAALEKIFPEVFENGELNRRRLREIVFADSGAREKLNAVTHPLIFERCRQLIEKFLARVVVLEAPLLFEAGFESLCGVTVCAVCGLETRIARLCARDRIPRGVALAMIAAQMDNAEKAALCDYAIDTEVSSGQLRQTIGELYREWARI